MNYKHFTLNERTVLSQLLTCGYSIRGIAKILHRSPGTISRELKRNSDLTNDGNLPVYSAAQAQDKYKAKRHNCG